MSMKQVLFILLTFGVRLLCAQDFVQVRDGKFVQHGKPYHFIGANMWYGCYLGSDKVEGGKERLVRELDFLKKEGITNLRVLGASELSAFDNHFPFTIQTAPDQYDESLLQGLDFLLAEMKKRDMKAVIYLTNYWNWSGGMGQYITWVAPDLAASVPFNPERKWEREMTLSSYFYSHQRAQEYFRKYVSNLVSRKNTFTNTRYKDDPTIMSWQLSNEPRPGMDGDHGESNIREFMKWINETAGYIHSVDPNHLVSSGNEGKVGTIQNIAYYEQTHAGNNIDYLTLHIWAKNWNWFDADKPTETFPVAKRNALDHLKLHINLARKMNKPLVMEEFGLDRDNKSCIPGTATTMRDEYFEALFEMLYRETVAGAPIGGANVWAWGGEGEPMYKLETDFDAARYVGDPFVEPQGLNSVFKKDKSTLRILKKYSRLFEKFDKK
ncbi:MAG TPA: cellulase family glycosylhydrolase [Cyclobacteriaceae bacterium]|nr:cellulase family glycosylhydrolase [Cyclobacteriaceae bacterium]HMV11289.1 cellulase family glycosylhydrolase [Cyclobacteriaceae bacterium]HMV90244.1 cellulase family glycosylhydrolase [Cyclobacteriaceae bacterium]HMX02713.1 cellulase family glycosylhydrolase [Cyclobacteriaceae bacterium]HMX51793.1 cellulase family glycosylhydrolase [Cyclobacteriaceae bacterium]